VGNEQVRESEGIIIEHAKRYNPSKIECLTKNSRKE